MYTRRCTCAMCGSNMLVIAKIPYRIASVNVFLVVFFFYCKMCWTNKNRCRHCFAASLFHSKTFHNAPNNGDVCFHSTVRYRNVPTRRYGSHWRRIYTIMECMVHMNGLELHLNSVVVPLTKVVRSIWGGSLIFVCVFFFLNETIGKQQQCKCRNKNGNRSVERHFRCRWRICCASLILSGNLMYFYFVL